jgi:hypothetical protein
MIAACFTENTDMSFDEAALLVLARAARRIKEIQANPPPADRKPLTKERMEELLRKVDKWRH